MGKNNKTLSTRQQHVSHTVIKYIIINFHLRYLLERDNLRVILNRHTECDIGSGFLSFDSMTCSISKPT